MTSDTASASEVLREARLAVDSRLSRWAERLRERMGGQDGEAVAYALTSPGKRVRAALTFAAYRWAGGKDAGIVGVAAAVETVHAYSLVHDDLPCMDDDDLRRGRLTTHRAFDVPSATRAGFLLVPVAAEVLVEAADELALSTDVLSSMAAELFQASGAEGMVGGQWLDLQAEGRALQIEDLRGIHRGKTGALIRAACVLGGLAGQADAPHVDALQRYGECIGLAFQIADDVLDSTATSEALGKTAGRDRQLRKATYTSVLGLQAAQAEAERLADEAIGALDGAASSGALESLAHYIVNRTS